MHSICLDCGYAGPEPGSCPQCHKDLLPVADLRAAYADAPPPDDDRFALVQLLGKGGMGEVHKAWQKDLRRFVAIKFVSGTSEEDRRRLAREARIAAQLDHPNVAPVYEADPERARIVMKYVDGLTLDRAALDLRGKVSAVRDAARAIAYAHGKGVLHRDLKPQNIMVEAGRVYVMDFGLARESAVDSSLSMTGRIIGTPQFMPPEQACGRDTDQRSDVYGLGATLYATLAGVPPFGHGERMAVLQKVLYDDPVPLRRRDPTIPRDLETIAMKALEKSRERRYASASEFADDLDRWLSGESILARPAPAVVRFARQARRHPLAAGAVLLVAVAVAAWAVSRIRLEREIAAKAGQLAAEADAAMRDHDAWKRTAADRRRRLEDLRGKTPGYAPSIEREALMRAEEDLREAEQAAELGRTVAEQKAIEALGFDRENAAARRVLARLYYDEYVAAENLRDRSTTRGRAERVLTFDSGEFRALLEAPATLSIEADAAAWLFRYEPRSLRLIPFPCDANGRIRETPIPSVDPLESGRFDGTAYPLETTDYNRVTFPLRLPAGSYLVLFSKGVRYPVLLRRGDTHAAKVRLLDEVPDGFVYIPAGRTIVGQDPDGQEITASKRKEFDPDVPGFILGRFSVTVREYFEFLNDASFEKPRLCLTTCSSPWTLRDGRYEMGDWKPDEPISLLWTEGLEAYCRWYTLRHGRGRWTFRLPTEDEWEKAARGADGRYFSWGDHFDAGFCAMADSRPTPFSTRYHSFEPVGLFPADESPYGVRDTAGVIRNVTSTFTNGGTSRIFKGGAWDLPAVWCRSSTRFGNDPTIGLLCDGLRLAASVEK